MSFERPCLVFADDDGNIYDEPDLHMLAMTRCGPSLPRPTEITPLPEGCELFLLPGRQPLGLEPETGEVIAYEGRPVAALVPSTHLLSGLPAYVSDNAAAELPPLTYAAVGFAHDRFYICAKKIDGDALNSSHGVSQKKLKKAGATIKSLFPGNRLIEHLIDICALTNNCPSARNFCLNRHEVSIPVSPAAQDNKPGTGYACQGSAYPAGLNTAKKMLDFAPTADELAGAMLYHAQHTPDPILSFGQNCGGDPLGNTTLLIEALRLFRQKNSRAMITLNTKNADPQTLGLLAQAGLSAITVRLNDSGALLSQHEQACASCMSSSSAGSPYTGQLETDPSNTGAVCMENITSTLRAAADSNLRISLKYAFFPGMHDSEGELDSLLSLISRYNADSLQLNNVCADPERYMHTMKDIQTGPVMGLDNYLKRIKKSCPSLRIVSASPFYPSE